MFVSNYCHYKLTNFTWPHIAVKQVAILLHIPGGPDRRGLRTGLSYGGVSFFLSRQIPEHISNWVMTTFFYIPRNSLFIDNGMEVKERTKGDKGVGGGGCSTATKPFEPTVARATDSVYGFIRMGHSLKPNSRSAGQQRLRIIRTQNIQRCVSALKSRDKWNKRCKS
jgi:hypothetical protein